MDPARKRTIRLTVALTAAVLLAGALIYTSFSASSPAKTPSQLMAGAEAGRSYQLTGKVAPGYVRRGNTLDFRVRDRSGTTEERFPASPAYALEIRAFEGELHGERSLLPDGEDSMRTVAVTQAVLQAVDERRSVAVSALVPEF